MRLIRQELIFYLQKRYFYMVDLVAQGAKSVFQAEAYILDTAWSFLLPFPAKNMKATLPETLTSPTDVWSQVPADSDIVLEAVNATDGWLYQLGYLSAFQQRPTLSKVIHAEMRR